MTGKKNLVYFPSWAIYGRNYQVADIPIDTVTDLAYAFFNIAEQPGKPGMYAAVMGDEWADTMNLQALTTLQQTKAFVLHLAIGGWTWSKNFSLAVRTPASREAFAQSIVAIFSKWPVFGGVSLDWEYLSNNGINYGLEGNSVHVDDPTNLVLFATLLRSKFASKVPLDLCVIAAPEKAKFPIATVAAAFDG